MTNFKQELTPTNFPSSGFCQPATVCQGSSGKCAFVGTASDYPVQNTDMAFKTSAGKVCGTWAVKDLDCPKDGCLGFGVKLSGKFEEEIRRNPPKPPAPAVCFPNNCDWTKPGFVTTTNAGQQCTFAGTFNFNGNLCQ